MHGQPGDLLHACRAADGLPDRGDQLHGAKHGGDHLCDDSDELPGVNSAFGTGIADDLGGLDVDALATLIGNGESSQVDGLHYIGQQDANYDGSCAGKTLDGLEGLRGLCPEEPTKQGSYYAASVAHYGRVNDIHPTATGDQLVNTYASVWRRPCRG